MHLELEMQKRKNMSIFFIDCTMPFYKEHNKENLIQEIFIYMGKLCKQYVFSGRIKSNADIEREYEQLGWGLWDGHGCDRIRLTFMSRLFKEENTYQDWSSPDITFLEDELFSSRKTCYRRNVKSMPLFYG